jgi:ribosomal protein S18 acetylase RimI-like enzyme
MEIRELGADELDYAVLPCVDPGFRKTLKQGMNLRLQFLKKMKREGLSILVALEDTGGKKAIDYPGVGEVGVADLSLRGKTVAGLIEYAPIEKTNFPVKGENLAFIHCIWVIPPFQKKGLARALMESFLTRTSNQSGATVIAYKGESWWGFFDYMPKAFFTKFGFQQVQRSGNSVLMLKDYGVAKPPELILSASSIASSPAEARVEFFWSAQCPYSWWVAKRLEKEFGKTARLELKLVNTDRREDVQKLGLIFGLRMDGKTMFDRMPSWDEIKKQLEQIV